MIGISNTRSEHQTIKHKVFDFLLVKMFEAEGKNIKNLDMVGITDLIDYVDELKNCYKRKLYDHGRHDGAIQFLDQIIRALPTEKSQFEKLISIWNRVNVDLEHCRERTVCY